MEKDLLVGGMKAYVLHNICDLRYEEVPVPSLTDDMVLLQVKAAGICGSDIPRIYTAGTYSYPLVPGHEFSGVVVEAGGRAGEKWLNKRAGVFPLIPCGGCGPCRHGQYEMCRKYSYLGSRTDGGFAEYVKVPVWNLIELPESVSFEQAAMLEPMAVAVHAMRRAGRAGDGTVVVCGLGAIGLLLTMFLLERGVKRLFLIGNKPCQREFALHMGVDGNCYCDSAADDVEGWLDEVTGGNGADIFFDCVGRNEVVKLALDHTAPGGTVFLVGNPASDMLIPKQTYWKILRRQLTVMGTWNSSFTHDVTDDWHYALERVGSGRICPERLITQRFALDELWRGFEMMRDKSEAYVKVMGVIK